jgi:hypothetical protein
MGNYSLCIAPAATGTTANKTTMKKYTYFSDPLDGHGDAPVQSCTDHLIEEVQGFTRSHWMPPLGKNYVR